MRRLLTSGVAGVLLAAASVLSAPAASASPVDKVIPYDCDIPSLGTVTVS